MNTETLIKSCIEHDLTDLYDTIGHDSGATRVFLVAAIRKLKTRMEAGESYIAAQYKAKKTTEKAYQRYETLLALYTLACTRMQTGMYTE